MKDFWFLLLFLGIQNLASIGSICLHVGGWNNMEQYCCLIVLLLIFCRDAIVSCVKKKTGPGISYEAQRNRLSKISGVKFTLMVLMFLVLIICLEILRHSFSGRSSSGRGFR